MDDIHRLMPADLLSLIAASAEGRPSDDEGAAASVRFSSYELLAKRCFELLPADYETAAVVREGGEGGEEEEEATTGGGTRRGAKAEIFLRVGGDGVTNVCGVAEHAVRDEAGLRRLLRAAVARRETSATGANATSSRSHAVYLMRLPGGGQLAMIDLAGNEGGHETLYHTKAQVAEAKEISNSLATLRACLRSRASKDTGQQHAPFRESVLTRVLKDALTDPTATTALLACVSPACTHLEHTLRTLRTATYLTAPSGGGAPGGGAPTDESGAAVGGVEEEELRAATPALQKGPSLWDAATLRAWVEAQPFGAAVTALPDAMTGKAIMKLTQPRLKPLCGGRDEAAAALFAALRAASKEADKHAREQRASMKAAGSTPSGAATGFAKDAPARPQIADPGP